MEEIVESCRQNYASELSHSDSDDLMRNWGLLLQSRVKEMISKCSDVGLLEDQEFGNFFFNLSITSGFVTFSTRTYCIMGFVQFLLKAYSGRFEQELNSVEAESTKVSNEIQGLIGTHGEGEDSVFSVPRQCALILNV